MKVFQKIYFKITIMIQMLSENIYTKLAPISSITEVESFSIWKQ